MTASQETTLTVPGISCQHCVQTITQVLSKTAGVQSVEVDLPTKTVRLLYDSEELIAEIKTRLAEIGYPVGQLPFAGRGKALPLK